jgi:hypothetical protein
MTDVFYWCLSVGAVTLESPLSIFWIAKMLVRSIALTSPYWITGLVQLVIGLSVVWQACGPNRACEFKGILLLLLISPYSKLHKLSPNRASSQLMNSKAIEAHASFM